MYVTHYSPRTDVSIRFPGNILPEGDTESETLGDFYDRHHSAQHRNGYFSKVPQELKHIKTPLINVVLFIDVAAVCFAFDFIHWAASI